MSRPSICRRELIVTGSIFGISSRTEKRESREKIAKCRQKENETGLPKTYSFYRTPLEDYFKTRGMRFNFKQSLHAKAHAAAKRGETLRVLDVGVGTGEQWLQFLKDHPNIELSATSLTRNGLHPDIAPRTKITTAATLSHHYPEKHFDVVISHFGMHGQEQTGAEQMLHVLKPGGHAWLRTTPKLDLNAFQKLAEVLKHYDSTSGIASAIARLRKRRLPTAAR
ncbi:MAG: class I SAM-dependent methyltransferase [Candidatus Micrarchaeota archaeon]